MNISLFLLVLTVVLGVVVNVNVVTATNQVGSIMLKGNKYNPAITTLESGLQYKIIRSGGSTGTGEHPTLYSPCKIKYIGKTLNSKIFDSSSSNFVYNEDMYHLEEEKEIASSKSSSGKILAPYQVIVCLQEAMQLMVVGDKWSLYCPSELAYGDIGSHEKNIYPGDMLMYDLELLEIFAPSPPTEDVDGNEILEILPPVPVEKPPPSTDTDTVVEDEIEIEIEDNSAPDAPDSSSFDSEL